MKAANRQAIIDAALDLSREHGPGGFSAVQLAERADVAKRTIFNHFASLDDAIYAGLSDIFGGTIEAITESLKRPADQATGSDVSPIFEDFAAALLATDFPGALSQVVTTLKGVDENDLETMLWISGLLKKLTPDLLAVVESRAPESSAATRAVMVHSLLITVGVAFEPWMRATGAGTSPADRRLWHSLLEEAIQPLRVGFSPGRAAPAAPAGAPSVSSSLPRTASAPLAHSDRTTKQ